ncbi:PREDICTED: 3-oxo-5-alpha-steroid 4-dehydrogenase 2 [Propithecus coquereli]|uniref:Steroid 5 alpha-reductase 2 n=1 Tax=Propithecus coquereli TaxID=379532 RepID=A0A2K6EEG0_PROCO|nr:PREDICTED: 3-oxo-5-alpha-steroid 4-dehydrogenase 2 [Propithecus coquereli]
MPGRCQQSPVLAGSATLAALGALTLYLAKPSGYGKYTESLTPSATRLPAGAAWFLQELPAFAVPAGILAWQPCSLFGLPGTVLLGLFCAHYFHRTFVYSLLNRGRPFPLVFIFRGFVFCTGNGFLQGYYLIYCAEYPDEWYTDIRFSLGGLFTYVSGANFFGEIVEWMGYALATWSLPALAFAFFSLCFLGMRAFHHHRFYLKMFEDYPKSRKALIPFIF